MKLQASFIKNIHATYGQEGKTWLSNLSEHLDRLSVQWNFQMLHPVKDLSYNFVAVVQVPAGLAILKTAPPSAQLMAEAQWLQAHPKRAPVIVYTDKENNAYLMEKLEPGNSLRSLVTENDEQATRILAQVILDLHSSEVVQQMNYQPIAEHAASFAFLRGQLDTPIIDRAESVFTDLCADSSNDIILHGDLHHDNILQSNTSWKVIDPHGYLGDPCAEVGPMIFNPLDCFPKQLPIHTIIERRLQILAEMLPFDLERIKAWAFCLAVRSVAWDIEGFSRPNYHTVVIVKILYDILARKII